MSCAWIVAALVAAYWLLPTAWAQGSGEDVHVTPRVEPMQTSNSQPADDPTLKTHTKPIKVDVNLVLVPVSIVDPENRQVTGLDKENFEVFEGKERQQIQHFSSEDSPVSLGAIFEVTDFTRSVEEIEGRLLYTVPKGRTAMLDAIYLGLNKMRKARYGRKALLIISDGGDNHSRYTESEVKNLVKESDVQIYAIGVYDNYFPTEEERLGPQLLSDITELTGGRAFSIDNPNDLADVATKIGVELRNQYVLGYRPTKSANNGKWHKIRVKLLPPKGLPPLQVHAKAGYYARSE